MSGAGARTVVNRVVLVVLGTILIVGGVLGVVRGFGAFGSVRQHRVLVPYSLRHRVLGQSWWWPTVYAVLSVLVVLGLVFFLVQLRRTRLAIVRVDVGSGEDGEDGGLEEWPGGGRTTVLGRAIAEAVADEAEQLEGVVRAGVRLLGEPWAPALQMSLLLDPDTELERLLPEIESGPLAHLADGLGLERVPARLLLTCTRSTRHRTR